MKFSVSYTLTLSGTMDVEATSEEEAKNKIYDVPIEFLCDTSHYGIDIYDCEPVDEDQDEDPTP